MKSILTICSLFVFAATTLGAAEQTWTGKISDSMCGAKHNTTAEHGAKKMSDRDCTLACVKDHNAKYVFVRNGKVYNIGNQDFAGLQEHAGHTVKVTGDMSGDTITVSKVEMPAKKAS
jgi:hypothetical protein